MTHCAAATALPHPVEHVHPPTPATKERQGQAHRNPGLAASTRHPATPDRQAFLAALLQRLPRIRLRRLHLIVSPDTILRWHRDLLRRANASPSQRPGRPPARRAIQALVLRLARENSGWGYRHIHGELAALDITIAPSTVWEILKRHGIQPAPQRDATTWAAFLRHQAHAILACDFFTATTLSGTTYYVFAAIEHPTRRAGVLGATDHPTGAWVTQIARNMVMDLQDADATVKFLIRDRDSRYTAAFDAVSTCEGITIVTTGIRMPPMNSIKERWVQTCRLELLDHTLVWNHRHLLRVLREFESFHNEHRPHRTLHSAAPLRPLPQPITDPTRIDHLEVHRQDRLDSILHQYTHAA
ncbi:MAG: Integrase catalytic region [Actinomycetia bacterium]|nr:Integrase catalytic region [Actinomycetes bacterium]